MNKKRYIAFALSLILLLAGCGDGVREVTTPTPDATVPDVTPAPVDPAPPVAGKDYSYAFERYSPEDIVLTVDGIGITWREYFYRVISLVIMVEENIGEITSWTEPSLLDQTRSMSELVEQDVLENLRLEGAIRSHARDLGVELTEENLTELKAAVDMELEQMRANGYDPDIILNSYFLTRESYANIRSVNYLHTNLFNEMYGLRGEKLPEADILSYIADSGLIFSKHILINTTTTDETGASVALPEEEMAVKRALAEDILAQINAAEDKNAKFDELMHENSEDPGLATYPLGYVFSAADSLAPEYRETMEALLPGEYSGLVETQFGYHIITRMEMTPDTVIETVQGEEITVRYEAAEVRFADLIYGWADTAVVEFAAGFEDLNCEAIFKQD